ncbi:phosphopantetheine-binding protein [Reichenbachiella sp. MALMAid0571]|uniref:acyl carrier protein n=1 Tax=Reichenbachiella sp. MALMAid0571 TaxID=3143939 RepID=UPI0032DFDD11
MDDKEIYAKLKVIIEPYLDDEVDMESLTLDSHLINELNINSAHVIDIVLDIENEFDIEIDDDSIMKMETIQNVLNIIKEKSTEQLS